MEALKIFVIILAVLGSTQALSNANELGNPLTFNRDSASSIATQAQEEALSSINATSQRTVEKADQARVKVQEVINQLQAALTQVQGALQQVATSAANSQLAGAITNPTAAVGTCISGKAGDLGNVTMQAGADVIKCFTDKIKEAQAILADVLQLGRDAVALGPNAIAGIRNCPALSFLNLWQRLVCLADETMKATGESVRIIAGLTTNVAKVTGLAATAQTDIQRCVAVRVVTFVVQAAKAVANIGLCIVGVN